MILLDANLLIYAHVSSMPQHESAHEWLDGKLNASAPVGIPWMSLLAFARLITNRRVFERPRSMQQAWKQIESWLNIPVVWIPVPTERHRKIISTLIPYMHEGGNLVPDAHLAALAIDYGLTLCTTDHDFARFPQLKWQNPILNAANEG